MLSLFLLCLRCDLCQLFLCVRFRQLFPEAYNRICDEEQRRLIASVGKSIRIQDAEKLIGSDLLSPACDLQTSITYSVVKTVIE